MLESLGITKSDHVWWRGPQDTEVTLNFHSSPEYPLNNATHYWNMKKFNWRETEDSMHSIHLKFKNSVRVKKHKQLGNVLQLGKKNLWFFFNMKLIFVTHIIWGC